MAAALSLPTWEPPDAAVATSGPSAPTGLELLPVLALAPLTCAAAAAARDDREEELVGALQPVRTTGVPFTINSKRPRSSL